MRAVQIERLVGFEDMLAKLEITDPEKRAGLRGEIQQRLEGLKEWAAKNGVSTEERTRAATALAERKAKSAGAPKTRP